MLARHFPMERAVGIHLRVAAREHGVEIQSRMFAPLVLARTIGQGFDMGRPRILEASAEKKAGTVTATYIGGRCVPMMRSTIDLT